MLHTDSKSESLGFGWFPSNWVPSRRRSSFRQKIQLPYSWPSARPWFQFDTSFAVSSTTIVDSALGFAEVEVVKAFAFESTAACSLRKEWLGFPQAIPYQRFLPYFVEIKPAAAAVATARPGTFDIAVRDSSLRWDRRRWNWRVSYQGIRSISTTRLNHYPLSFCSPQTVGLFLEDSFLLRRPKT